MTENSANARIYDVGSIYLAPIGTALPTTIDEALAPAFEDVGWIHSDGIVETLTGTKSVIRGYQRAGVVRTRMSETGTQIQFNALEDKAQTKALRYHEKQVTMNSGVRKAVRGSGQRVSARVAVIDFFDEDNETVKTRLVIPRLEITPNGDRNYGNADIASFPFAGEVIGDYEEYATSADASTDTDWKVTVTGSPTGGSYSLSVNTYSTAAIAYNANATAVAAAINALAGVTGISGVTASGSVDLVFPSAVVLRANGAALTGGTTPDVTVVPN